jgi:hypothetical protein
MNVNEVQTYVLVLMAVSAMAGACFALLVRMTYEAVRSHRQRRDEYDPWEPRMTQYEEPMPHMLEAPISARKK